MGTPPPPPPSSRRAWAFFALLLLLLVLPQVVLTAGTHKMSVDGGYYLDVAMHWRDSGRLLSDVSLYHAGFPYFPHPSPIYPLWPVLLGSVGRLAETTRVAHWLPFSLWVGSLFGAYLFGRALLPAGFPSPGDGRWPGPLSRLAAPFRDLNAGHLMVLMLGTQREYSRFSTMPYTEALAFLLLMLTLWRLTTMRARLRDGIELGLWLALLCLCRSQLFIAPMAVALAVGLLALAGGREGRRWLVPGAAALGIVGLALFAWWQHSRAFIVDASPLTLLRFDQAQATRILSPLDVIKDSKGPLDFLLDRLSGLPIAWSLSDWDMSYARGFFAWHFALPVALLFALPAAWKARRSATLSRLRALLSRPDALSWLTLILLALGALATVHLPHKDGFDDWYFRRRHAIICVLPFFLSLAWLARRPGLLPRLAALTIIGFSIGFTVDSLYWRLDDAIAGITDEDDDSSSEVLNDGLVAWLQERASAEEPLVVALYAFKPPELAWRTDHVGYHWFYERTALEDLRKMSDELGARYVLTAEKATRGWAFREDRTAFIKLYRPIVGGPPGVMVFERRKTPQPPAPDPAKKSSDAAE